VHCPVRPVRLAELAGAVERVDDPDPARAESLGGVLPLLGQHLVGRTALCEFGDEQFVRAAVALLAEHVRVIDA
jgi:hypothetical protein